MTWSLVIVAATTALLLAIAHATKAQPGECNGIGFGCSLHGKDAAGFAAIFVVPAALALLVIGNAVIAVIGWASRRDENTRTKSARHAETS
jgi:hypothetical protein